MSCAARADESRQALVLAAGDAIQHLIDNAVDAGIAGVVERNAGRLRIREREAGIDEALIAEARTGVKPTSDPVRSGKACGCCSIHAPETNIFKGWWNRRSKRHSRNICGRE